jgi:hypothetical protein
VTALIAVGFVLVRWWIIGPHRVVIASNEDLNEYEIRYGIKPFGKIELEYYQGLRYKQYISTAFDIVPLARCESDNLQYSKVDSALVNQEKHVFLTCGLVSPAKIKSELIVRVVAEVDDEENMSRQLNSFLPSPTYRSQAYFLSDSGSIYISKRKHVLDGNGFFNKITLDDVPPSIRQRVSEELDAIRRKQSAAN